ncbi:MAG: Uma2 family endonuclease [Deltaproteobacteria bacterium]|nr:Uma2 family endonuclease [Deltaproteobacteria bacterium]
MADAARRRATYQDVLKAPAHMVAEVVDGELHLQPRPALIHAAAASALGEELGPPFKRGKGGPGGWILLDEPELHLGADIVVPDMGGWLKTRLSAVPDDAYLILRPDWVAEVLSPRTERFDRITKLAVYAREQVPWVWLVNPRERMLEILNLGVDGRWILVGTYSGEELIRAQPFDAIEFDLAALWADAAPLAK